MLRTKTIIVVLLIFGCFALPTALLAQDSECGAVVTPAQALFEQQWQLQRAKMIAPLPSDHYRIPIAAHIVRRSDGTGGLTETELLAAIDTSNVYAASTNVSFYLLGAIDYINADTFFYHMDLEGQWSALMQTNVVSDGVNVYFVPGADTSGVGYCGLSTYPGDGEQGIIINNDCVNPIYSRSTLFHEVGHYFALYHTHETYFGTECPNGSNCDWAGDLICDTEADPNLNGHVSAAPACIYDQYASTPPECDATPYNPPVNNIMSYSTKLCRTLMSEKQMDKFRAIMIDTRTELRYIVNGFSWTPARIVNLAVLQGTVRDTAIRVVYMDSDTATILSAVSATGNFQISATLPAAVDQTDTIPIGLSFDATGLTGPCDLGNYVDTIIITTSKMQIHVIATANVTLGVPSYTQLQIGPTCLPLMVPVTPGIGNSWANSLLLLGKGILYDGSLVIAMRNGNDTVAYMDLYNRNDFTALKDFTSGADTLGRQTQRNSFVTKDGRFSGEVTYTYGANSLLTDSCMYYIVDYTIKNPCDTALTFATGAFCDFDVDYGTSADRAWAVPSDRLVLAVDQTNGRVGAVALLSSCSPAPRFRTIDNVQVVWPTGNLPTGSAYKLLIEPISGPTLIGTDVSTLLSFGQTTLPTGGEVHYRFALIATYYGPDYLPRILANLQSVGAYAGDCPYVFGDATGDGTVDISDAVYLIAYIFSGGLPPNPVAAGDANCDSVIDISDVVYLIAYIFSGGPAPCSG